MRWLSSRAIVPRHSSAALLFFGLLFGAPTIGFAQEKSEMAEAERERYENLLEEGKAAYSAKNFEKAFEKLKGAHDLHPKSSILFNLGLISEKQGKLERASKYYQKFVEAPDVSLEARQRASERMAAVNEILNASGEGGKTETQKTNLMPALEAISTKVDEGVFESDVSEDSEESGSAEMADAG